MHRVGFYDHPIFREHEAGSGHPENAARADAVARGARSLERQLRFLTPREATHAELLRVHTPEHVDAIAAGEDRTLRLDPDTTAGPRSYRAALQAAGAVADAVERVLDGDLERAFCCVRPPGHHAEADRAMGFCLFNNVAVGAAHALARGLTRVMVIDFDVHHGNGTQHIFESDARVLYLSSHAFPFYPGTGALHEMGEGEGRGFTVNLPLPGGCGDAEYASVYRDLVVPIGRAFDPELLLVSAGFDPGRGDPISPMDVTPSGFAEIANACLAVSEGAAQGRAVFVLEGGYDFGNLEEGTAAVLQALMGEAHARVTEPPPERFLQLLDRYRRELVRYWTALGE